MPIVPKSNTSRFRRFKPVFSRQESKGNLPTQPKLHSNLLGSPKQQPDRKYRANSSLSVARRSSFFGTLKPRQTTQISQISRVCSEKIQKSGFGGRCACCGVGCKGVHTVQLPGAEDAVLKLSIYQKLTRDSGCAAPTHTHY